MSSVKQVSPNTVVSQTKQWVLDVIIGLNFCPFAKKVFDQQSLFYKVVEPENIEESLLALIDECMRLDKGKEVETTLIIYPTMFKEFTDYLDFLELANQLLEKQNYNGIYQLASFHPDYCFTGVAEDAAENYTNRSPYPMLHLIRESSLEKALESYTEPEQIPLRNIERATQKGSTFFKQLLNTIKHTK
ncbi:hypothetical protein MNBD_GAMMA23-2207 [hydrothermal vent metagenome]|uniref:DUF1415 domain-containing protein n=1 Tax=hydrothermal vent metagenome TaxID=652676 RepID=A0A3B1A3P0_9ZZZZ